MKEFIKNANYEKLKTKAYAIAKEKYQNKNKVKLKENLKDKLKIDNQIAKYFTKITKIS